ncbi:hypothetical protein SDC9_133385 [bioreactor metagenome]|uniref:Uncharacterized protein n=1 Tax=bioreactor metagenome TaxID=1076179 RepID=A0A645DA49_9ZZZZ
MTTKIKLKAVSQKAVLTVKADPLRLSTRSVSSIMGSSMMAPTVLSSPIMLSLTPNWVR